MSQIQMKGQEICPKKFSILKHKWYPAIPTEVFYTYWEFAAERQNIFFNRIDNNVPWTEDAILKEYKFTNAYRVLDRVSQYLIKEVIYKGKQSTLEVFFRIIVFKTFNKIATWEKLIDQLGEISWSAFSFNKYNEILSSIMNSKAPIYSAAYIMTSGKSAFGCERKHQNHLKLIELLIKDNVPDKLSKCKSMQEAFILLRSYPTIGDFLAYQYVTDINYSNITDFSEMSFVVPGPGALDGISKCFSNYGGLNEVDIIKLVADRQSEMFELLDINFKNLWGRNLQLIDCQNLFCEISKYSRVSHPRFSGVAGRKKIKQKFRANHESIKFFFPPKWEINIP